MALLSVPSLGSLWFLPVLGLLSKVELGVSGKIAISSDDATLILATIKISHRTKIKKNYKKKNSSLTNDKANIST